MGATKSFIFSVRVQDPDSSHVDTSTVTVNVYDINDNAPVVTPANTSVTVPETATVGTEVVAGFTATDADQGVNAQF